MSGGAPKGHGLWLRAIAKARLSKTQKSLCWALLGYIRLHDRTGEAWPSEATLARDMSVNARTVRRARNELERIGIIEVLSRGGGRKPSGAGIPNRVRLVYNALLALAPEDANPDIERSEVGHRAQPTRTDGAENSDSMPDNQTIHQKWNKNHPSNESTDIFREPPSVRQLLQAIGVRGKNLDTIAQECTAEDVQTELSSIKKDHNVRNPAAVLVQRLKKKHGLQLAKTNNLANSVAGEIEQIR